MKKRLLKWLWQQRMWWMIPLVVVLLLVGVLMFLAFSTPMGSFTYTQI